jgi:hypothetical protein
MAEMASPSAALSLSSLPGSLKADGASACDACTEYNLVESEEQAVRSWLLAQGFKYGDLRSDAWIDFQNPQICPMARACQKGQLNACKWLYAHGASADITKANNGGNTSMHWACQNGHLSVCKWLFEVGATTDIVKADNNGCTPMFMACSFGHLSVCKWLFEVGAAADVTKANNQGKTPMFMACEWGHLSVCKWLYEVGGSADITTANKQGRYPMFVACMKGHLSICQWLFDVGAAAQINKTISQGRSPMYWACMRGHTAVCEWLIFNGAMNRLAPALDDGAAAAPAAAASYDADHDHDGTAAIGHVDRAIARRDTPCRRPALLAWAQDVVATHRTFLHVVLRASVILPDSHQQVSPGQRCHLPRLPRVVLERLVSLLGVEMGRRLRNVREFADAILALGVTADDNEELKHPFPYPPGHRRN